MMFGTNAAALMLAHSIADHWVQTDTQAINKGEPGWAGWRYNLRHVSSYVATQAVAVLAAGTAEGRRPSAGRLATALAVSGVAHAWADRREPLRRLAVRAGKGGFWSAGAPPVGHGGYQLDQAWHHATSVLLPALILTGGTHDQP